MKPGYSHYHFAVMAILTRSGKRKTSWPFSYGEGGKLDQVTPILVTRPLDTGTYSFEV